MVRKKRQSINYSKSDSFEKLEAVQEMALNRKGKDDELNPDISLYLKAEELKGKLMGLYIEKEKSSHTVNMMGNVVIDGKELEIKVGESLDTEKSDD